MILVERDILNSCNKGIDKTNINFINFINILLDILTELGQV